MRKVIMFNRISLDGYFSGPHGENHEWFVDDPQVEKVAHKMMQPDTVLMGRVTYKLFESVWPKMAQDPKATKEAKRTADELTKMTKIVFSKKLKEVTWENSKLVHEAPAKAVKKLKRGNGPDIVIFGSGSIVQQLTAEGLIDEYLFVVTPIILGEGKLLFKKAKKPNLDLLKTKDFKSGNVMIHYSIKK